MSRTIKPIQRHMTPKRTLVSNGSHDDGRWVKQSEGNHASGAAIMNTFQTVFEQQKRHFASGVTRTYQWRIEQLDRMARLVGENQKALQQTIAKKFKTTSQEQNLETSGWLGGGQV